MPGAARVAIVVWFAAVGLLGCLSAFGPDIRPRGVHAGVRPGDGGDACLGCHEPEADALARVKAGDRTRADAALVADWMIEDERACTVCHAVRGSHAG